MTAARIPFSCPRCGSDGSEAVAVLLDGFVHADPIASCLRCEACGQAWRVELHPMRRASDGRWEDGDDE